MTVIVIQSENRTEIPVYVADTNNDSVFTGPQAGAAITTGANNTLIGANAGKSITTGSNNTIVGPAAGSTTLASNVIVADGAGTARFTSDASSNAIFPAGVCLANYTVAGLATYAALTPAPPIGALAMVTDSNQTAAANPGVTVTGGGSTKFPVYFDGTNWKVM